MPISNFVLMSVEGILRESRGHSKALTPSSPNHILRDRGVFL